MKQWEYCEIEFDGKVTTSWIYDEAGEYIDRPRKHARLGVLLAQLGHEGWELVSTWYRINGEVTYMLKRPCPQEWTEDDRKAALEQYRRNHPRDRQFS